MAENINRVTITGNLTADPDLRQTIGGTAVCTLRVAVNGRRKDQSGTWVDKPNYFNVVVWGAQGQNCANYLSKGRPVAVDGRLDWREWEAKDGSGKRSTIEIVADTVQFLGSGDSDTAPASQDGRGFVPSSDAGDFAPPDGGAPDDDIPF